MNSQKPDIYLSDERAVKIKKISRGFYLNLPKPILEEMGWDEGDRLKFIVNKEENCITVIEKDMVKSARIAHKKLLKELPVNLAISGKSREERLEKAMKEYEIIRKAREKAIEERRKKL